MPGWNNAACTYARLYHDAESRYRTLARETALCSLPGVTSGLTLLSSGRHAAIDSEPGGMGDAPGCHAAISSEPGRGGNAPVSEGALPVRLTSQRRSTPNASASPTILAMLGYGRLPRIIIGQKATIWKPSLLLSKHIFWDAPTVAARKTMECILHTINKRADCH